MRKNEMFLREYCEVLRKYILEYWRRENSIGEIPRSEIIDYGENEKYLKFDSKTFDIPYCKELKDLGK